MRDEPIRPPDQPPSHRTYGAEVYAVGLQAEQVSIDLARVVGAAASAGVVIDDEVTIAVATLTSWSAWLRSLAIGTELAARTRGSS
jgi:hypothetical protein